MILRGQAGPGEISPASQPAACSPDEQPDVVDPNLIGVDCQRIRLAKPKLATSRLMTYLSSMRDCNKSSAKNKSVSAAARGYCGPSSYRSKQCTSSIKLVGSLIPIVICNSL